MAIRRIGSLLLLAMLATVGCGYTLAQAQEPSDLTKLTLEELMKIDVVSINVLATHIHSRASGWLPTNTCSRTWTGTGMARAE